MDQLWVSDKETGGRYGNSRKWTWDQVKRDPKFPRPVKFSNGCTRFSVQALNEYDAAKLAETTK